MQVVAPMTNINIVYGRLLRMHTQCTMLSYGPANVPFSDNAVLVSTFLRFASGSAVEVKLTKSPVHTRIVTKIINNSITYSLMDLLQLHISGLSFWPVLSH